MQHEQRLRRPALCRPHRPLLSRVFPVATAIKVHDAVRSRIRWAFVQGQLCDIRNDTYGMSPRFHVYRLHPLGRCEGEHRNGLSFGFGLVHFRRGHCRLVDEGRVGALPARFNLSFFRCQSFPGLHWYELCRLHFPICINSRSLQPLRQLPRLDVTSISTDTNNLHIIHGFHHYLIVCGDMRSAWGV